jgi:ATP-dependent Lhr-like helicase
MISPPDITRIQLWFEKQSWEIQSFQKESWESYFRGEDGLVVAPTGSGKTYSILIPAIWKSIHENKTNGLNIIWITPIRSLAKEIEKSAIRFINEMNLSYSVGIRTGDTSNADKQKLKKNPPNILITTPESLQLLLSQINYANYFQHLQCIVCDEWHELMGTKRAVQMELAISRLKGLRSHIQVWGISATIGNINEALEILIGKKQNQGKIIRADIEKKMEVITIFPDIIEKFPWGGHLGIKLLEKVIPVIEQSKSVLIFTNTRSQSEIWYQQLLDLKPEWAGWIALHHGSIDQKIRHWVEDRLYEGKLKAVICTSSLDLGVDFRPVDTVIQIGGPKGIARFMQRCGRSGHAPGEISKIYFVPTHSLEIIEGAALRNAIQLKHVEKRIPYIRSFDVLIQYLVTLAVSDGFKPNEILQEIRNTVSFESITDDEFQQILQFITTGGSALNQYDDFHKVVVEDGVYKVINKRIAMRHRLSIGTIISDSILHLKYYNGKRIGQIEEWFISKLKPGDVFFMAGSALELIMIKDMDVIVKKSKSKSGIIPSWQGGRMPLSSELSLMIKKELREQDSPESNVLQPLYEVQKNRSIIPDGKQFLIEKFKSKEGYHVFFYPFEGRFVHEGMAALFSHRISKIKPITFSIAMSDYGFELLSDQYIPLEESIEKGLFEMSNLYDDIRKSINDNEMAKRKFRDIARISGLVFNGYPGRIKKEKHLQAGSQLFFNVFNEYDPGHLLLKQAYEEVYDFQLEQVRLRNALENIGKQEIKIIQLDKPSPFCFPIMAERIRDTFSNEKMEDRIRKMISQLNETPSV